MNGAHFIIDTHHSGGVFLWLFINRFVSWDISHFLFLINSDFINVYLKISLYRQRKELSIVCSFIHWHWLVYIWLYLRRVYASNTICVPLIFRRPWCIFNRKLKFRRFPFPIFRYRVNLASLSLIYMLMVSRLKILSCLKLSEN